MTNNEFSDMFSTLLNSYATQAQFGEEASRREIVLDEYEKSVFLTQAQDIIVKSYFDATLNSQGQGFDDNTRRQVDFSSLIRVEEIAPEDDQDSYTSYDERGIIFKLPSEDIKKTVDGKTQVVQSAMKVLFILNEKLGVKKLIEKGKKGYWIQRDSTERHYGDETFDFIKTLEPDCTSVENAKERYYWTYAYEDDPNNDKYSSKEYVVVPINYKEYDREMSKPFSQPLKKQAWRLFQNTSTGFDIYSEVIPKWFIKNDEANIYRYKLRYVRRPQPIILEDLPDGLEIDGNSKSSICELNPILHMDILNKAVEIAVATRGGSIPQAPQQGAVRRQSQE